MPPERLADYVDEFQRIVAAHGVRACFTGHASAGCMHVRPMLDLKTAAGVGRTARPSPSRWARLVAEHHGAISGEHGDGCSRTLVQLPSCSAPTSTPRSWRSRTCSTRGACSARAARSRARRSPRTCASAPATAAASGWRPRLSYAREGGFEPGRRALLRRGPLQEADRHHVPAGGRHARRVAHHAGARQPAAGLVAGAVPLGASSARRSSTTCSAPAWPARPAAPSARRRRHGRAQGRVAGRGATRATACRRSRAASPTCAALCRAGGAGRAARQRAGAQPRPRALMPLRRRRPTSGPLPSIARRR